MDYKELKKKKAAELTKILAEERNKLRDLRFKDANKQLKDVRQIRKTRVNIARIITLLNKEKAQYASKAGNTAPPEERKNPPAKKSEKEKPKSK